MIEKMIHGSMK